MIFTKDGLSSQRAVCTAAKGKRVTDGRWIVVLLVGAAMFLCALPASAQGSSGVVAVDLSGPASIAAGLPDRGTEVGRAALAAFPDAPAPAGADSAEAPRMGQPANMASEGFGESSSGGFAGLEPAPGRALVELKDCPYDQTGARECRMHWKPMAISSSIFMAFENGGNLYTGYWYRWETTHGKWWDRTIDSAAGWRWDRWSDDNPWLDDYVGHPMMGAITNSIWIQNDPKGMTLEQANSRAYWRSRLRATAWSTFYSFEWKLGPIGEASIGHNGDHYFSDGRVNTNETGWVELVTTPVGGLGWTLAEDFLDKHLVRALEEKSRNPLLLTAYQFLNPARGFANILRFRPPWYRDARIVKAQSFWSDPGEGLSASTQEAMKQAHAEGKGGSAMAATVRPEALSRSPGWEGPGGRHEFGALWGLSLMSGHIWGYAKDVKYMPVDLRYSYEFYRHKDQWAVRYSPELTAIALLDWPTPNAKASFLKQRTRVYGSGVSPVGIQWDFLPLRKVEPFLSTNGGMVYYGDRVLSPQGSQFMYTIDYGAGFNFFRHGNQAVTIGYRYQHLSNANISHHNPGTDTNLFYVGISRFRNKGR